MYGRKTPLSQGCPKPLEFQCLQRPPRTRPPGVLVFGVSEPPLSWKTPQTQTSCVWEIPGGLVLNSPEIPKSDPLPT